MPDPMDELEHFTTPGLTMTPLPASEVRRRGTRMRRRNNALATLGGVAAVAIIATPIALAATGNDPVDRTPAPAGPSGGTAWLTLIPDTFPLTEGIGGTDPDAEERTKEGDPTAGDEALGVPSVEFCGETAWTAGGDTIQRLGATYAQEGTENINRRTLALYADGDAADAAFETIRRAAAECPESENRNGDTELVEVRDDDLGSEESFVVVKQWQAPDDDFPYETSVMQVAHTGNSLLVTEQGAAGGDQLESEIVRQAELTAPVAEAMDAFAAQPAEAVDEGEQGTDGTTIPAAFPLLDGLPTDDEATDERFGREGPSTGMDPIVLEACGSTPAALPAPASTLRAGWRDAPGSQQRALMTFTSDADAAAYVDGVLEFFAACGVDDQGGIAKVYHVTEEAVGDQAASVVMGIEVDGEAGVGMQVVQVIRVGQTVLLVRVDEDGNIVRADDPPASPGSPASLTAEFLDRAAPVVAAMESTWG